MADAEQLYLSSFRGFVAKTIDPASSQSDPQHKRWLVSARALLHVSNHDIDVVLTLRNRTLYYQTVNVTQQSVDYGGDTPVETSRIITAGCVGGEAMPPLWDLGRAVSAAAVIDRALLTPAASNTCSDDTTTYALKWAGQTYIVCTPDSGDSYEAAGALGHARVFAMDTSSSDAAALASVVGVPLDKTGTPLQCQPMPIVADYAASTTRRRLQDGQTAAKESWGHILAGALRGGGGTAARQLPLAPTSPIHPPSTLPEIRARRAASRRLTGGDDGCCNCRRRRLAQQTVDAGEPPSSAAKYVNELADVVQGGTENSPPTHKRTASSATPYCVCCMVP